MPAATSPATCAGNCREARPIDDARIGREAGDDHLGALLVREPLHLLVIDFTGVGTNAVLYRAEQLPGKIDLGAVREMTAVIETHAENRIARLHQRQVSGGVGLRA
jgi:hypothetical protein